MENYKDISTDRLEKKLNILLIQSLGLTVGGMVVGAYFYKGKEQATLLMSGVGGFAGLGMVYLLFYNETIAIRTELERRKASGMTKY